MAMKQMSGPGAFIRCRICIRALAQGIPRQFSALAGEKTWLLRRWGG